MFVIILLRDRFSSSNQLVQSSLNKLLFATVYAVYVQCKVQLKISIISLYTINMSDIGKDRLS